MSPIDPAATLRAATAAHEAGRLDEAESLYRACLAAQPAEAEALHGLGWLCVQRGDWRQALRCFGDALRIKPWEPELWISQLEALMQLGQVEAVHQLLHRARASGLDAARVAGFEARLHERRLDYLAAAVKASGKTAQQAMQPPQSEVLALRQAFLDRKFDDAREKAKHLLKRYPLAAFGWRVMALVTPLADDPEFAMLSRRLACELDPEGVDVAMNLALALHELTRLDEAEVLYRDVLARQPDNLRALVNLGLLLNVRGNPEAETLLRKARSLGADDFRVLLALGGYLRDRDQPAEAIPLLEAALQQEPGSQMAAAALAICYLALGRHEECAALYRQFCEGEITDLHALDIVLFVGTHLREVSPTELFDLHRRYGDAIEAAAGEVAPHANDRSPDRRIRVGFVSGDLRKHAMASFVLPLWRGLDRRAFALHAFHNHVAEDGVTEELRALTDEWTTIVGLSDDVVADAVRKQGIDVLVDLSGHTGHHRLGVFARKPAPVQISAYGYPATTGLSRMDYYLADTTFAPPGMLDAQFTEKLMLGAASAAFLAPDNSPDVAPTPALSDAPFTFGSFNRTSKITPMTVQLWANVLRAVPESRMVIGATDESSEAGLRSMFEASGVAGSRLVFLPRLGLSAYLEAHAQVDLLLDTAPYSGGTTTCYGLWMGVPTLTLPGQTLPSRSSAALVLRLGLDAFVTESPADFVGRAAAFATPEGIAQLSARRGSLRETMSDSNLGSPRAVSESFEDGVRIAWRRWCAGLPAAPLVAPPRGP